MPIRRFVILYIAMPLALAAIVGVRGSVWLPDLTTYESVLLTTCFVIPNFWIGAGATYFALWISRQLSMTPTVALLAGIILTIIISHFFVAANMQFLDQFFPGLAEAQTRGGRHASGSLVESFTSPDTMLFIPFWLGMHFTYEWGSGDAVFFPRLSRSGAANDTGTSESLTSVFLSRVPNHQRSRIIAIEADKHYTIIHGQKSESRLLYRFGDAVIELEALDLGIRVHRSWWVAWDAVKALEFDGRNLAIQLLDGKSIPVSQSNFAAVRRQWGHLQMVPEKR